MRKPLLAFIAVGLIGALMIVVPTRMRTTRTGEMPWPPPTAVEHTRSTPTDVAVGTDNAPDLTSSEPASGPLTLAVDSTVTPDLEAVAGLEPGDASRPVGRMVFDDGEAADLVLGELIVATADRSALDDFIARYDGEVVDVFRSETDDPVEYLVRVSPPAVAPAAAARALATLEPGHGGEYRLGDPSLLAMIHIAASETVDGEFEVALNQLSEPMEIADGEVEEAFDRSNPFGWRYLRVGGPLDHGVAGAWQLIDQHGKDDNEVRIAIGDGGFFENDDFPSERKIRLGDWNVANPGACTGGTPCPWHGTDTALTAMGQIDNGFGTAGVAGQVGVLIAVELDYDYWTQMRSLRKVVEEERPSVLNLSFSVTFKAFRDAQQHSADRHIKAMRDDGALVITGAGNDGRDVDGRACVGGTCFENRLVMPCESIYAVCVGGTKGDSPWLHDSSNYGSAGGSRSVEMYAPFCVMSLFNPVNPGIDDTTRVCGTSYSAPFVAGAAALVKAADMSLSDGEVLEVLRDTAHLGGVHFDHFLPRASQRRVNVLDAVASALGVEQTAPELRITAPSNGLEVSPEDWFDLEATAVDFKGQALEVAWESSIGGPLGTSFDELTAYEWAAGSHDVSASATDANGATTTRHITIHVVKAPPVMGISWPAPGAAVYEAAGLTMIGSSKDPATHQSLADDSVNWVVSRDGFVTYTATGHSGSVPPGVLTPGHYDVTFGGGDGGSRGEATTHITVLEVVGHLPVAAITSDLAATYGYGGGAGVALTLEGTGNDQEDGGLPGTRFRWIARTDGHERVLCNGSEFSAAEPPTEDGPFAPGFATETPAAPDEPVGPPVFGVHTDCSSIDIELGLAPGAIGQTEWTIALEVVDSDGQVGEDPRKVIINYAAG